MATTLRRCRTVTEADPECEAAWEAKRRHFFRSGGSPSNERHRRYRQFLSVFSTYIDSGFGLLGGEVGFLSSTLIVIDVTIAALFWAWGTDEDVLQRLVKKTLYIGVFAFIIGNFQALASSCSKALLALA
jgi:type IV secretory pathway TrbL component